MSTQKKWRIGIIFVIWTLFVALMGAVSGSRPERIRTSFIIPPTATPEAVVEAVVDSRADTQAVADASSSAPAVEVVEPAPAAAETAPDAAAAPADNDTANVTGVTANEPVTTTVPTDGAAPAADLPAFVDLPPISSVADPMVVLGEDIFQRKAGGVGCQLCHGVDARGLVGPSIVGKTEPDIRAQFETNAQMQFIILSDKEMTAVATYLQFLADPSAFPLKAGGATAGSAGPQIPAPTLSDPLILQGQELYQATAGGIGCQLCHGAEAVGALAPEIVGRTADDIRYQFANSTAERLIKINDQEMEAIAGYLLYLADPTAGSTADTGGTASSEGGLSLSDPLVAQGEQLYQFSAGDVGCQLCHGMGAKGGIAPEIVGKTAEEIHYQFEHSTAERFIKMTDAEIDAVAIYLQYLATQP